ncbi:MAG TPA: YdcF family protein, partial [Stellaceae bacterium]|nr:YdcF family protein [Stellaceae bacterium]
MFVLGKLYWYIVAPGNLLTIILLIGAVTLLSRRRRTGAVLAGIAAVGFAAILVTPIPDWTILPLEDRFPRPRLPDRLDGIVVLGGAVDEAITRARHAPTVNDSAERVIETAALARRYPAATIVLSGGEGLRSIGWNEAAPTRDILESLGVPAGRMVLETRSRNTIENAEDSFALVHPQPGQNWLLVTSAFHMSRAVGCFRHVGWQVIPYPVDYRTAPGVMRRDYFLSDRLSI